ncbi:MAG: DUF4177 domain-containing protein [Erysipelotrichaceae bacterium]|nr:DUF4177 domain-containing protein [Erysipelotrichaceae bacterium]
MKEYFVAYASPLGTDVRDTMNTMAQQGWRVVAVTFVSELLLESSIMITFERDKK